MKVTKEFIEKNIHLNTTALSKLWVKENNLDPFKVEKYRHEIRKIRPLIEERKNISESLNKEVINFNDCKWVNEGLDKKCILVIGDIHLPYEHEEYLEFNKKIKEEYNPTHIVFIGDILDNHAISYHESNPNLDSAGKELEKAREKCKEWAKVFPNVIVTLGNHDFLYDRKIQTIGLPSVIAKDLDELLDVKGWKFVKEYEIGNHYFTHGTKLSEKTIIDLSLRLQKNVICGHLHTSSYIRNITQKLFVSHIGCGIDSNNPAFAYGQGLPKENIMSSLIIKDNQPILIKM